ncbi:MAG: zinc ribbon domain-containing protein [Candidatus Aenigmatarchaeota archaeon]
MICRNCGSELKKNWKFCPECGAETGNEDVFMNFGKILNNITKQMMKHGFDDRESGAEPENVHGFSINIIGNPSGEPDVEVRTFGDSAEKKPAKYVAAQKPAVMKVSSARLAEPRTIIKNLGSKIIVEVELPGIKEKDISVEELEESLEIKASAKGATYFKIITVPEGYSLSDSFFENSKLTLELSTE